MGKDLRELLGWPGPLTHRQYLAWQAWLDEQLNAPGKEEYYLMQVAAEVRRGNAKKPKEVKMEHFKLRFFKEREQPAKQDAMHQAAISKATWFKRLGLNKNGHRNRN